MDARVKSQEDALRAFAAHDAENLIQGETT
jgi:hypothetical protein